MNIDNIECAKELKEERDALLDIVTGKFCNDHKHLWHFEFVEHYGSPKHIKYINRKLNERLFEILKERIVEIEEEIKSL